MIFLKHLYKSSAIQILLYSLHFLLVPLIAPLLDSFFNVYGSNEGAAVIAVTVISVVIFSTLYISDSTLGLVLTSVIYYLLVLMYHTDKVIYEIGNTGMFDFFSESWDIVIISIYVLIIEVATSLVTKFFRFFFKRILKNQR